MNLLPVKKNDNEFTCNIDRKSHVHIRGNEIHPKAIEYFFISFYYHLIPHFQVVSGNG